MDIYIGNLSFEARSQDLRRVFERFGKVANATIILDRAIGKSRGFGFVEMPNQVEANTAIRELNGKEFKGKIITVSKALPRGRSRQGEAREPRRKW